MKKIKNNLALKELFMDRYTDESLLKMFNKVANAIIPSKSGNWYQLAKKGTNINGIQFTNKTHNTPSVTDTNLDMANYSLKLVKKKKKYLDGGNIIDNINDSGIGTIVKLVDPTGITSYYDVYKALENLYNNPSWSNAGALGLEAFGAVPLIGKFGKFLKLSKFINKISKPSKIPGRDKAATFFADQYLIRVPSASKDLSDYGKNKESKK